LVLSDQLCLNEVVTDRKILAAEGLAIVIVVIGFIWFAWFLVTDNAREDMRRRKFEAEERRKEREFQLKMLLLQQGRLEVEDVREGWAGQRGDIWSHMLRPTGSLGE